MWLEIEWVSGTSYIDIKQIIAITLIDPKVAINLVNGDKVQGTLKDFDTFKLKIKTRFFNKIDKL